MKKIIIIGGGIAGLTAGIYAQKCGFESIIYEKHTIAGGECTGWDRQGCHIDGCIHWLTGTLENTPLNDVWKEVGALDGVEIINFDSLMTIETDTGAVTLWRDIDKLKAEFIRIAPNDKEKIDELINDVKLLTTMQIPIKKPFDLMSQIELLEVGKLMEEAGSVMKKNGAICCKEYTQQIKSPILKTVISSMLPENYSIVALLFALATFTSGNGAFPKGGSLQFVKRMESKYKALGGKLITNAPVDEIIIKGNRVSGVRLEKSGEIACGDYVVAACDTNITFNKLLDNSYMDDNLRMRYANYKDYPLVSSVYISLCIDDELEDYNHYVSFKSTPYKVGANMVSYTSFKCYSYEPSFSPKGKSVVTSIINQFDKDYEFWKEIYKNKQVYKNEKARIASDVVARIEERFPALMGKITVIDVATPITYERYLGAYMGAWMSFMMTPAGESMSLNGRIKGLENCHITGQWLEPPGGLPTALSTGRFTIQRICNDEGMLFVSTLN